MPNTSPDLSVARRVMVDNQIRTFDVTDRDVLSAFDHVPRDCFVPEGERALAYTDRAVGLNGARTLLLPLILARLVQAMHPVAGETALDVCGGLGYSAAILAAIGLDVTMVETSAALTDGAKAALASAGARVSVAEAQPMISAQSGASFPGKTFDLILINGASEVGPTGFFPLLAEGGRLGLIFKRGKAAQAAIYLKANGIVSPRLAFDAQASVLPGFAQSAGFVF